MAESDLPKEVRDLVARHLHSMEEVELLVMLAGTPRPLGLAEIRERLRLPPSSLPLASVQRLVASNLITAETNGDKTVYSYEPANAEQRRAVELLTVAYNERPVTLVRLVYHRRTAAQSFADAFRIRSDDEP